MDTIGELKTFNAAKGISMERDLKLMLWHTDAMIQSRSGIIAGSEDKPNANEKKHNQVTGLNSVISAQQELISTFRAEIKVACLSKYNKSQRNVKEGEGIDFMDEKNDYNKIMLISESLNACRMDILEAERTKMLEDDFILDKQDSEGNIKCELTTNFYEMLQELENSFEDINIILLVNKCISAGIEEDDESTYKEKEAEMVKRVEEA